MIQNIEVFYGGFPINDKSTNYLLGEAVNVLQHRIESYNKIPEDWGKDADSRYIWLKSYLLKPENTISVNTKNIEYIEQTAMSKRIGSDILEERKKVFGLGDVDLKMFVYRVGQHSYFAVEATPLG